MIDTRKLTDIETVITPGPGYGWALQPNTWRSKPPTEPGYYWTWAAGDDAPVLGEMNAAGALGFIDGDVWYPGDYDSNRVNGRRWWLGPLRVPSAPE